MRTPLDVTLAGLLGAVGPEQARAAGLRTSRIVLDVPLEVRLDLSGAGPELLANLPRWRWTTVFDSRPGRLRATFDVRSAA